MSTEYSLTLLHLYPWELRTSADVGNLMVMKQRMARRSIELQVVEYHPGDPFPQDVDIIYGGGAQDSGQFVIEADLQRSAEPIRNLIETGVPALLVHASYQLFGTTFITEDEREVAGFGVFDAQTIFGGDRIVGNVVIETEGLGTVLGYENHAAKTILGPTAVPLGQVIKGIGNNDTGKTEGVRYKNAIGTYLYGPLLAMNPKSADRLIKKALEKKYQESVKLDPILEFDGELLEQLRTRALDRPR